MDAITEFAEGMRRQVESKPQGCSHAAQQMGTLYVHLARFDGNWRLELNDEKHIPGDVAHAWVRACGAPEGTPILFLSGGRVRLGIWEE